MIANTIDTHRNPDLIRWITIAGGFMAAAILSAGMIVDDLDSGQETTILDLIFPWSLVWFFTNAIRFLDAKDSPWIRLSALLPFGLLMSGFGIAQAVFADYSISDAPYQMALAAGSIAIAVPALMSAIRSMLPPRKPMKMPTLTSIHPIAAIRTDPLRWLTIGGGTLLAVSIFASPTFVPVAVAATCGVRYADTMQPPGRMRLAALALVSAILIATIALVYTDELRLAIPGCALLLATSLLAMFRSNNHA